MGPTPSSFKIQDTFEEKKQDTQNNLNKKIAVIMVCLLVFKVGNTLVCLFASLAIRLFVCLPAWQYACSSVVLNATIKRLPLRL